MYPKSEDIKEFMQYSIIRLDEAKQFVERYFYDKSHDSFSIRINKRNRDVYEDDYILKDKENNLFVVSSEVFEREYASFLREE